MRALVSHAYGPLDTVALEEIDKAAPGPGQLLVRVEAAALNGADPKLVTGTLRELYDVRHPFVPGMDLSGVVEAVGEGVAGYEPGDAIVAAKGFASGAIAEFTVVKTGGATVRRPEGLGAERAAAAALAAQTAYTVVEAGALKPDETVLVVGASGGVGNFAVQLAKQAGARVLATGRADEFGFLRDLGADEVIDYRSVDVAAETQRLTSGGVDVVLDVANAGPGLVASAAAAKPGGRLVSVLDGPDSFDRNVSATYIQTGWPEGRFADLMSRVADGRLKVEIGASYTFDDAAQALVDFAGKHIRGKVTIVL